MSLDNAMTTAMVISTLSAYLTPDARRDAAETLDDWAATREAVAPIDAKFIRATAGKLCATRATT